MANFFWTVVCNCGWTCTSVKTYCEEQVKRHKADGCSK